MALPSIQLPNFTPYARTVHRASATQDFTIAQLRHQYKEYIDDIECIHTCVTCGKGFQFKQNFQGHFCFTHTGFLNGVNRWECCGATRTSLGCVSSVHFKKVESRDEVVFNPLKLINVPIELVEHGIVKINTQVFSAEDMPGMSMKDCYQMFCIKQE